MSDLYGFSEFLFFAHIENKNAFRTVRCSGRLGGRGSVCLGGGVCLGGVFARHPPPWPERQTGVKTLPCRNYFADGKYIMFARFPSSYNVH